MNVLRYLGIIPVLFCFHLSAQVEMRDTIIYWDQFEHSLDQHYSLDSYSSSNIVETSFAGIVLENELVRLSLIPEYGARILSFYYKPTGKEQLYLNPVGVPYAINSNIFYHDWLMVFGGIFPTFPEPEHGKYWNVPWNYEVKEESEDKITISMWLQDDLNNPGHPGQYNNGETGITCFFDVTLEKGKPFFDVDVRLENNAQSSNYEYWTCITFSPGSELGNTYSPSNSEIIAPIDYYEVGWNPNNWMQNADETHSGGSPFVNFFENLKYLYNWENQGIAYAYPDLNGNHFGVINQDNRQGLFRIAEEPEITPGMKFWTWGDSQGLEADPYNFNEVERPYIELWAGVSHAFFQDAYLAANETISWKESYMSTAGIPGISYIDTDLAFFHQVLNSSVLETYAFLPVSDEMLSIEVSLLENTTEIWSDNPLISADLTESSFFEYDFLDEGIAPGIYELNINIGFTNGQRYAHSEVINLGSTSTDNPIETNTIYASRGQIHCEFDHANSRVIELFDLQGRKIESRYSSTTEEVLHHLAAGIYVVRIQSSGASFSQKVWVPE